MDLYRLNLNLLVALDTLFSEKSVTEGAKKLSITQAAMSNNLQQLREIFKDELLIREKNKMVLTSYARELEPKLHLLIEEVRSLVTSGQRFIPQTSQRIFKIGMSDYLASLIIPKLLKSLEELAPGIKIIITTYDQSDSEDALEHGGYDLAIGKQLNEQHSRRKKLLFKEKVVCILNPAHPLAKRKKISLKDYLNYQHASVKADSTNTQMVIDNALRKLGTQRNSKIALPYIVPIFQLIDQSKTLIGCMIESLALLYSDKYNFVIKPIPFKIDDIGFYLFWHQRFDNDQGHSWLRQQIINICSAHGI